MPVITPGTNNRQSGSDNRIAADQNLERASATPKLSLMKEAIESAQSFANTYSQRNTQARDWWMSRWAGQTTDGLRWATRDVESDAVWPWPGASDSRIRLCERLVNEHNIVARYALQNMKVQAKSSRPFATMKESQQVTTLLNWMLFTHMGVELAREQDLMLAWRHGYGSAVTEVCWETLQRLEHVPVTLETIGAFIATCGAQLAQEYSADQSMLYGGAHLAREMTDREMALGFINALAQTPNPMEQLQSMVMDPAYEDDLARVLQAMSPVVTKRGGVKILNDLRALKQTEVPVPKVFVSRPRWTTLRVMVDVLFPEQTDDLQRPRWIDRVEWVTETELQDRVETAGYSQKFVNDAIGQKGVGDSRAASGTDALQSAGVGLFGFMRPVIGPNGKNPYNGIKAEDDFSAKIELHHFYHYALEKDVPVLFETVLHMKLDDPALHDACPYDHGQMPFHAHRFETIDRPITSSRGIPEIAYTWEQEIKKQIDGRTDRVDMTLRPPIATTYEALQKMKASWSPGVLFPMRKFDEIHLMPPPPWDPGSIEIEKAVEQRAMDHFPIFHADPQRRQLYQQGLGDTVLGEYKPVIMQTHQLMQQLLPDAEVARVVGPLSRPFHISREDIRGAYEISATVDMRELDAEWISKKASAIAAILPLDAGGVVDRTVIVQNLFEGVDYNLADMAIRNPQQASQSEVEDEQKAFSLIVGSGRPQPLPKAGNFQLRLQTLQNELQTALRTDPDFQKRLQVFPGTVKVLQARALYYQRQITQMTDNAAIGRAQVADPFTKAAPALEDAALQS